MSNKFIFQTLVTDVSTRDKEGIGRVRIEAGVGSERSGGDRFRWVQNAEAAATDFSAGQVAFHKLTDGMDMLKKVYVCATANLSVMAGVVMGALQGGGTDTLNNTYTSFGWVQIAGIHASVSCSTTGTSAQDIPAGDYMKGVNAAKHVTIDAASQPLYTRNVQLLEACTTTTGARSLKCQINCL